MTRNVVDNAILLSAMSGKDPEDVASKDIPENRDYLKYLSTATIDGLRFGVITKLLANPLYKQNVEKIVSLGGIVIEFEPIDINFDGFNDLLSADMKKDLPNT